VGVASDLPAVEAEDAVDGVVIEVGVDVAAESPKDEDVVFREQSSLAEVDARLEVDRFEVAVEVVLVIAAIGRDALAIVAVEPIAGPSCPCRWGEVLRSGSPLGIFGVGIFGGSRSAIQENT
jgi:hypothetical protein